MSRFRKKPVEVEAMQIDPDVNQSSRKTLDANSCSIASISGWMMGNGFMGFRVAEVEGSHAFGIAIQTREGTMTARPGDWIVRGTRGEFYPCKPDAFADTFEPLTPAPTPDDAEGKG